MHQICFLHPEDGAFIVTIENKTVAITGAGRGIGRATAIHLAARGARLVLGARSEMEIAAVAGEIEAAGGEAIYRATDVTRRADLDALVAFACERFARLDVFVNNAGIGPLSRFDALQVDDWNAMIDVNLKGALYGIAAALPVFSRQDSGHIVNVISTAGIKIVPTMGVYAATKNALRTATEALRQESGPQPADNGSVAGFYRYDIRRCRHFRPQRQGDDPKAQGRPCHFSGRDRTGNSLRNRTTWRCRSRQHRGAPDRTGLMSRSE